MDFKRISVAIKRHTTKRRQDDPMTSINKELKKKERKRNLARQTLQYSLSDNEFVFEPKSIYLQFDSSLKGEQRYQYDLLQLGNKAFSQIRPIRGTLNDEKLDYFTWRLHSLYVQQLDREEEEEEIEVEQEQEKSERSQNDSSSSNSAHSSSFSSNSAHSSSSSAEEENKQPPCSIAMTRIPISCDPISEPGWIDMQDDQSRMLIKQQQQQQQQSQYFHHSIIPNEALAAIPLLEREQRHFRVPAGDEEDDNDSIFDQFYDIPSSIQQYQNEQKTTKPIITVQDLNQEGDEEDEDVYQNQSILPPPLLPASMFHRASFGFRTNKPQSQQQKRSNSSISMTKLKNLFSTSITLNENESSSSSSVKRPQTLFRAQSEPIAQWV